MAKISLRPTTTRAAKPRKSHRKTAYQKFLNKNEDSPHMRDAFMILSFLKARADLACSFLLEGTPTAAQRKLGAKFLTNFVFGLLSELKWNSTSARGKVTLRIHGREVRMLGPELSVLMWRMFK